MIRSTPITKKIIYSLSILIVLFLVGYAVFYTLKTTPKEVRAVAGELNLGDPSQSFTTGGQSCVVGSIVHITPSQIGGLRCTNLLTVGLTGIVTGDRGFVMNPTVIDVYDDGTSNSPYSRVYADSFQTNAIGQGKIYIEGSAIDANSAIKIGGGLAGGQTTRNVVLGDNNEIYVNTSANSVGIGTTAPQAPLHILGAAVANYGTLVIQSTSNGDAATGWVSFYDSGGTRRGFVGDGSGTNDDIYLRADTGDLHLGDSSSSIVMNLQSGTVGIGILSPDNTLHILKGSAGTVTGTTNAPLVVENSTSSYIHVLSPAANEQGILFGDPTDSISGGIILGSSNQMQLRSGGNTTQVTILSDGSVGVGTTSPLAKLDVRNILRVGESINAIYDGSVPAHGGILIKSSSGQSRTSWIYQDNTAGAPGVGGLFIQSTHNDVVLDSGTVVAADILLNPNVAAGNVGIGTNNPGATANAKLEIYGTNASSAGPHVVYNTTTDVYPVFQQLNWAHNNVALSFDAYYNGGWKSSNAGSNYQIYKTTDQLRFNYNSGTAAGSAVTFNTGLLMTADGNIGLGGITPVSALDVSTGSNSLGLRLRGAASNAEIADFFVGGGGQLVIATTYGTDTTAYIDLRPEDDQYGVIIREGTNTTTDYANFYVHNFTPDYLNIVVNNTSATEGLNIMQGGTVGVNRLPSVYEFEVQGNIFSTSWVRTNGTAGIFFNTYGGGFNMTDTTWIRTYGSKNFYHNTGIMRTDGTFQVAASGARFIVETGGNVGINSTAPGHKLDVITGEIRVVPRAGNAAFSVNDHVTYPGSTTGYQVFNKYNAAGSFVFRRVNTIETISPYTDLFYIDNSGNIWAAGSKAGYVTDTVQNTSNEVLKTGNIVTTNTDKPDTTTGNDIPIIKIKKANKNDTAILGVVDQRIKKLAEGKNAPEYDEDPNATIKPNDYVSITTLGSFKAVTVNTENGAIAVGDPIALSSTLGIGAKAIIAGNIVGYALESYTDDNAVGAINVFIRPSWYDPNSAQNNKKLEELTKQTQKQQTLIESQQEQIDELKRAVNKLLKK